MQQFSSVQLHSPPEGNQGFLSSKPSPVFELWFQEPDQHGGLEQYHWTEGKAPEVGPQLHRKEGRKEGRREKEGNQH